VQEETLEADCLSAFSFFFFYLFLFFRGSALSTDEERLVKPQKETKKKE
jgi:hypothetical protein